MFKFYLRASLVLTALALLAMLTAMRYEHSSSGGSSDFDLLVCAVAFILAFIHSGIVSLLYLANRKDGEGSWAMLAHGAFIVMPIALLVVNGARERYDDMQMRASPSYKMTQAITDGTAEEFDREWLRANAGGPSSRWYDTSYDTDWAMQAALHGRLDILQALAAHSALGLDAQSGERYGELVHAAATCSDERCATQRLPVVRWLVEQGKAQGLTLKTASAQLFDNSFATTFDVQDASTVTMIELMIAEGADINTGDSDQLLRGVVQADKPEYLQFLLAHGYARSKFNKAGPYDVSLLGLAIDHRSPKMIEGLLAAGVVARHKPDDDDVLRACRDPYESEAEQARAVVDALRQHGVRLTKAQFDDVSKDRELNPTEQQCLQSFVR